MVPPVNLIPAAPTASAAPALFSNEPAQVLLVVSGLATVIAPGVVGKVSVKVAAVSATELLLFNTMLNVETPVTGKIGLTENDLVTVGAASTVMLAVASVPLDAAAGPVTVKPPTGMVLSLRPTLVPVTVAVTVHEPPAGIVPAASATVVPPAVLVPTQVPPGTEELIPDGMVSVKAAPVMATAVGLLKVMVSVDVPLNGMVTALKALVILGRATFKVALAAAELLPMLDETAPAAMVLV